MKSSSILPVVSISVWCIIFIWFFWLMGMFPFPGRKEISIKKSYHKETSTMRNDVYGYYWKNGKIVFSERFYDVPDSLLDGHKEMIAALFNKVDSSYKSAK